MYFRRIPDESEWMSSKVPRFMLKPLELRGLQGQISRELRLFSCACVRHIGKSFETQPGWHIVDVAEAYADGNATPGELKKAHDQAELVERLIRMKIREINSKAQTSRGRPITEDWMLYEIDDWHPEGRRLNVAEALSGSVKSLILRRFHRGEDCAGDWNVVLRARHAAHDAIASREELEEQEAMFLADDEDYLFYEDGWQADLLRCIFGNPFRKDSVAFPELNPQLRDLAESIYRERTFERMPDLGKALESHGGVDPDLVAHCKNDSVHSRGCWALDVVRGIRRVNIALGQAETSL